VGHENKCALLHGHNYRVHFTCEGDLDNIGRVIDFAVIKERLCMWLENHWDHKFVAWEQDEVLSSIIRTMSYTTGELAGRSYGALLESVVWVPFNPTAENMAAYLLHTIGPEQLAGTGVTLLDVVVEETRKCSARAHSIQGGA
jgi:6-pyruvoyltetrahydropterin/6-carboxytetrahydropterin synthase